MRACDNPFRVQRLASLAYRLEGISWEALLGRWDALGRRAAIVGPEGRGKSTLLAELAARLVPRHELRVRAVTLRRGERRLETGERRRLLDGVDERDLLLVDGTQELAAGEWRRLRAVSHGAGGLLVTSHRPGLLPTLHECRTTPALLGALLAELLTDHADAEPGAASAAARVLFTRHDGNLRDALLAAYDLCARGRDPRRLDASPPAPLERSASYA